VRGRWWDPYNQKRPQGDYPIFGQRYFLNVSASATACWSCGRIPLPPEQQRPAAAAGRSGSADFFGTGDQSS